MELGMELESIPWLPGEGRGELGVQCWDRSGLLDPPHRRSAPRSWDRPPISCVFN